MEDFTIEFACETILGGEMKKRGRPNGQSPEQLEKQLRKELQQMIGIDPVSAGERLLAQLSNEIDYSLQRINETVGNDQDGALLDYLLACRLAQGFGHDLATATGKTRYEHRGSIWSRLPSEHLQRRARALRGVSGPVAPLPPECNEIIAAIKALQKPSMPKIFEGLDEQRRYFEERGWTEVDGDDFESRTGGGPSSTSPDD